jgi:hypothetical protein
MVGRALLLLVGSAVACGSGRGCEGSADDAAAAPKPSALPESVSRLGTCPHFRAARVVGRLEPSGIVEASGVVASRKNNDVLWIHNDSGHAEQLFAVTTTGKALATYSVGQGATCIDWEAIALGQGPDKRWYLYVGDTGTNQIARNSVVVYRVLEPEVRVDQPPLEATLEQVETIDLMYPDRQVYDSETLMVDPQSGDLFLVTKTTTGRSGVYRASAPLVANTQRTLELVATLQTEPGPGRGSERTTDGNISPDGRYILIRTYTRAYLWIRPRGATIGEALATAPCVAPLADEPQGEAIGFSANGLGYFTVSEGSAQPIYFFERKD